MIGETGKLEFKLVDPAVNAAQAAASKKMPPGDELVYSDDKPPVPYVLKDQVLVSGENLVDCPAGLRSAAPASRWSRSASTPPAPSASAG